MNHFSGSNLHPWITVPNQGRAPVEPLPGLPLTSPRLTIRLFQLADEAKRQVWAKFNDPYRSKYNFEPHSPKVNRATFLRLRDRLRLGIDDQRGELVGYISLKPVKNHSAAGELGLCFAADQVRKGYGQEALRLFLSWSGQELGLDKIVLEVDQINRGAIRLYEHVGFVKVRKYWKEEEHTALKEYFSKNEAPPEFRKKGRHLEVLSWVMEWIRT